jgi:metal-responsive CopG/Arc/MetJ family transcriptional regulator
MARKRQAGVNIDDDQMITIDAMAAAEHRSRSQMIRILLIEAIAARRQRDQS